MIIKAKKSFSGIISMGIGETREYNDKKVIKDLVSADYIEIISKEPSNEEENEDESKSNNSKWFNFILQN